MITLEIYNKEDISRITRVRKGETKLGECVEVLPSANLGQLKNSKARFVLLGLPEDIGVRANYGRKGANTAWQPALSSILNVQSNDFLKGDELLVLGHANFDRMMEEADTAGIDRLREMTQEVDVFVARLVEDIVKAGKILIVIGGGHNNAYGNIKGSVWGLKESGKIRETRMGVINCDAHSDMRTMEGRHSGNGFSYAFEEGFLHKYAIVGLHENYNSQNVLNEIKKYKAQIRFSSFEDIFIREEKSFRQAITEAIEFTNGLYCGIELDMDSVQNIPSSAKTSSGISANQARQYVSLCAKNTKAAYLHIAEAAPVLSHIRADNKTGKLIAYLVTDFIKGVNGR